MKITKETLLEKGLWVNDIENIDPKCDFRFEPPVRLQDTYIRNCKVIGAYTYIRAGYIQNIQSIGRFCSIARGLQVGMGDHPISYLSTHPFQYEPIFPFWKESKEFTATVAKEKMKALPIIGNDVWVGTNVTLLRGVTIGDGAVIAAGSVVNKDVKPYEIVGGVPAKHIRFRFDEDIIQRLLEIQWWDYTLESLAGIDFSDIHASVEELEKRKAEGKLQKRKQKKVRITHREFVEKQQPPVVQKNKVEKKPPVSRENEVEKELPVLEGNRIENDAMRVKTIQVEEAIHIGIK